MKRLFSIALLSSLAMTSAYAGDVTHSPAHDHTWSHAFVLGANFAVGNSWANSSGTYNATVGALTPEVLLDKNALNAGSFMPSLDLGYMWRFGQNAAGLLVNFGFPTNTAKINDHFDASVMPSGDTFDVLTSVRTIFTSNLLVKYERFLTTDGSLGLYTKMGLSLADVRAKTSVQDNGAIAANNAGGDVNQYKVMPGAMLALGFEFFPLSCNKTLSFTTEAGYSIYPEASFRNVTVDTSGASTISQRKISLSNYYIGFGVNKYF